MNLANRKFITGYITPFLHIWIILIFLSQFAFDISFIPYNPILLSTKLNYSYIEKSNAFGSTGLLISGKLPKKWFHCCLFLTVLFEGCLPSKGICIPCLQCHCNLNKNKSTQQKMSKRVPHAVPHPENWESAQFIVT